MVFTPPAWLPTLPFDPPDSIPLHEFWGNERYGRTPLEKSRNPFTCGLTGKTYTSAEMTLRFELLARALAAQLGWHPKHETPWDKVVGVFALNSVDYIMSTYAVHRLSGIATPASAMYSPAELEHQLRSSGAKALITCAPLLETALKATRAAGIPDDRVFVMDVAGAPAERVPFKTLDDLIAEGRALPELEPLAWAKGQGGRQVAYLCYSSGTSGLPKAVMISHLNIIANIMQIRWYDQPARTRRGIETQAYMALLPLSHIYGLVVVANAGIYRGDSAIVLPRFELKALLECIQRHKVGMMHLVPPIIITLLHNTELCAKYDLSSMRLIYTGAAPLGAETHEEVRRAFPGWDVAQGYGMTETATVVCSTSEDDIVVGTSGSLLPRTRARIVDEEGREVREHGRRGELHVQSPSVALGYHHNERATAETFVFDDDGGRWIRTGDVAVVSRSPAGHEHFSIVDRIKELIKVKGHQVAPAELEAHLLSHPAVADCAVIPVPDHGAGEVPKAFVVKSASAASKRDEEVAGDIRKHVEEHKARYKWLKGGIDFIDAVPRNPSGKILRRMLKDREKEARKAKGPKL